MRVIVIVADGLQAGALGAYGNDWIPTPNLDRLAVEAVVFDQHFADVPAASVFGVRHVWPLETGSAGDWMAELAQRRGECECVQLDTLIPPWELPSEAFEDAESEDIPEPILDPAKGLIDLGDELLLERIQLSYAAIAREFDRQIGGVLDEVSRDDLLILTAGRGQNLGEHGLVGDDLPWLHEELIHLPLFVRLPGSAEGGRRVSHMTQTLDIGCTVLDALGAAVPQSWQGHSLLPLCRGSGPVRQYICAGYQIGDRAEYALQTPDEKIIVPQGDPLRAAVYFVKPDDRYDVNDLRQSNLERAEALELLLRNYVAASRQPGPFHPPPLPQPESSHGNGQTGG